MECIAYILARQRYFQQAATLLGAADGLRKTIDSIPTLLEQAEYQQELSALHDALPQSEFEIAWAVGQKLSMEDAINLALR
jgi:hypothetical protein